jgi:hypothetical protein
MEVGQGPNEGCSAKERKNIYIYIYICVCVCVCGIPNECGNKIKDFVIKIAEIMFWNVSD